MIFYWECIFRVQECGPRTVSTCSVYTLWCSCVDRLIMRRKSIESNEGRGGHGSPVPLLLHFLHYLCNGSNTSTLWSFSLLYHLWRNLLHYRPQSREIMHLLASVRLPVSALTAELGCSSGRHHQSRIICDIHLFKRKILASHVIAVNKKIFSSAHGDKLQLKCYYYNRGRFRYTTITCSLQFPDCQTIQ